jgi:hypothetical protein
MHHRAEMLEQRPEQGGQIRTQSGFGNRLRRQDDHHTGIDQQRGLLLIEPDQVLVMAMGDLQPTLSM